MNLSKILINNLLNRRNLFENKQTKKEGKTCRFCSMIEYTTSSCATKMNIGIIISGDELIDFLKDKYTFKPIENDQVTNIYRSVIN